MRAMRLAVGLCVFSATACSTKEAVSPPPVLGDGSIKDLSPAATASEATFRSPLDATLSPDGKTAYFIALKGDDAAIFTAPAPSSAAPTELLVGSPLAAPFGLDVSSDGNTLVIADPGALLDEEQDVRGELFALSTSGGAPTAVSGASGYRPRGVVVTAEAGNDVIYFSGKEKDSGVAGVFKVALGGGAVSVVAKGEQFVDPSGLAVMADGTVFVADVADPEDGTARVFKLSGGAVTVFLGQLAVGYPAGLALSQDEKTLLVSARDPETRTDAVIRAPIAGGEPQLMSEGIAAFQEPAGLHRAKKVDTFIWADSAANSGGTVYVINQQR